MLSNAFAVVKAQALLFCQTNLINDRNVLQKFGGEKNLNAKKTACYELAGVHSQRKKLLDIFYGNKRGSV